MEFRRVVGPPDLHSDVASEQLQCLCIRMEQLGSEWADFHEILYFNIFRKSAEKIQVSLTSDKNKGYFI